MEVKYGEGKTEFGPGVSIELTGDEVARAIYAYLVAQGVHVSGPRTVTVNGALCKTGRVYVDPNGFVIADGERFWGCGPERARKVQGDARRRTALTATGWELDDLGNDPEVNLPRAGFEPDHDYRQRLLARMTSSPGYGGVDVGSVAENLMNVASGASGFNVDQAMQRVKDLNKPDAG